MRSGRIRPRSPTYAAVTGHAAHREAFPAAGDFMPSRGRGRPPGKGGCIDGHASTSVMKPAVVALLAGIGGSDGQPQLKWQPGCLGAGPLRFVLRRAADVTLHVPIDT